MTNFRAHLGRRMGAAVLAGALALGAASAVPASATAATPDTSRIVGGHEADPSEYLGFLASLQIRFSGHGKWSHNCGASVINSTTVLTAGHCISPADIAGEVPDIEYRVVFGATRLPSGNGGGGAQVRKIVGGKVHPTFVNGKKIGFDAALLELDSPLVGANPVLLPTAGTDALIAAGSTARVYGWGFTGTSDTLAKKARAVDVPLLSKAECRIAWAEDELGFNGKSDICAGARGKAVNGGDSGGPLVKRIGKKVYQIGIVSRGIDPAGSVGSPDVYTYTGASGMWKNFLDEFVR